MAIDSVLRGLFLWNSIHIDRVIYSVRGENMSHKIGKNNARNRENRKKREYPAPIGADAKKGDVVKSRDGTRYRVGERGNLIRIA